MKKLTTGIFTVLLGLVAIDANAAITSKAYVDAKVSTEVGKVNTKVTELNTTVNDFTTNIGDTINTTINQALTNEDSQIYKELESKASTADLKAIDERLYNAEGDIDALEGTVGTSELATTDKTLTGAINELNTNKVTQAQVTTDIAAAVKVETDRATAAEQANANAIAANTAAVEQAQADATQALSESIKQIKATGEDGTYVLTIKTIGDQATLKWEQIERAEATQTPEA